MYTKRYVFLLVVIFNCIGVYGITIKLTPAEVNVVENSSATLTCSKTNGDLAETIWTNSHLSGDANLLFFNVKCISTRFLKDSDLFAGVCNSNGTYSVVLKKIGRKQHGAEWMCDDPTDTNIQPSEKVVIDVSVPASHVTLSPSNSDYMRENNSQKFTCITSACRPLPKVQWYLGNSKGEVLYNLTLFSSNTYIDKEYGLKAVESTLDFQLNRTINDFRLYCEVWTQVDKADIRSGEMLLNETYPPDHYPKIEGIEKNNKIEILESGTGFFICSVTGGNPLASLSWNCFGSNDTTLNIYGNIVTSRVVWKAHRNYSICSCKAYYMSDWIRVTNITVDVQFSTNTVRDNVIINKTDNATLICLAEANPSSNITIENPKGDIILEESYSNIARHTLWNVTYLDAGVYTCRGKNKYTRDKPASSRLTLIVKCPPKPSSCSESVVTLATAMYVGVTLSFSVLRYLDVPNKTIFRWFRGNEYISEHDNRYIVRSEEFKTNLSILNTSDQDLGLYQVSVWNSFGEYTHYYVLNAAAHRSMETVSSKHIGEFIGVGAGECSITLVIVAFVFIGLQRAKKVKFSYRKRDKQGDIIAHKPSVRKGNQVFSAYAELDENKKESYEYDTVNVSSTSSEQQDVSTQEGASAYIEMKDARQVTKDTKEYVNITI